MLSATVLRNAIIGNLRDLTLTQDGVSWQPFQDDDVNEEFMQAVLGAIAGAVVDHIKDHAVVTGTTNVVGTATGPGTYPVTGTGTLNPDVAVL